MYTVVRRPRYDGGGEALGRSRPHRQDEQQQQQHAWEGAGDHSWHTVALVRRRCGVGERHVGVEDENDHDDKEGEEDPVLTQRRRSVEG